ncbi:MULTISPECIES: L,D-transpeptidase [Mycolicibacterium]|nr:MULTISPECIES: L,D-transpeptidase [Mycolicibacterium]MCV7155737.1 L,D-transpeptidase [Mycolicibacterium pyrenivorans]MDN4519675.1 L,D-transpeptidase [Mycolicibacterium austroafricanum]
MRTAVKGGLVHGTLRGLLILTVTAAAVAVAPPPAKSGATAASGMDGQVAMVRPGPGQVVGVGHPVLVGFSGPVDDRAAAERSITVGAPRPVDGEFTWLTDRLVEWNPDGFWPAHSTVTLRVGGMKTEFTTGAAVVGVADVSAHTFTVKIDDQVVREMPASLGKPGFETPLGTFKVLEKQRSVVFDSRTIGIPLDDPEGYLIDGEYAVRVTWGGVYVHSAPWSVGSQGSANVSHGCINLSPENAEWYFNTVKVGDPVIVQS